MTPAIMLVDDHPMVRRAIGDALSLAFGDVRLCEYDTLDAASAELSHGEPVDLILLDLSLPGSDGLTGLMRLMLGAPLVPVAIVSATKDPAIIDKAMACGAAGYILKSMPLAEIIAAVRTILSGNLYRPNVSTTLDLHEAMEARSLAHLSPRQYEILMKIVDGQLNKQIAAELAIGEQTVKIHVSTILRKLNVGSRTQAALLAERVLRGG